MITIRIPISENDNEYTINHKLLTNNARNMLARMNHTNKLHGRTKFTLDDFRGAKFGSWRDILNLFFELESRQFGMVRKATVGVNFILAVANVRSIQ